MKNLNALKKIVKKVKNSFVTKRNDINASTTNFRETKDLSLAKVNKISDEFDKWEIMYLDTIDAKGDITETELNDLSKKAFKFEDRINGVKI